jgi:hypothetical protein
VTLGRDAPTRLARSLWPKTTLNSVPRESSIPKSEHNKPVFGPRCSVPSLVAEPISGSAAVVSKVASCLNDRRPLIGNSRSIASTITYFWKEPTQSLKVIYGSAAGYNALSAPILKFSVEPLPFRTVGSRMSNAPPAYPSVETQEVRALWTASKKKSH